MDPVNDLGKQPSVVQPVFASLLGLHAACQPARHGILEARSGCLEYCSTEHCRCPARSHPTRLSLSSCVLRFGCGLSMGRTSRCG